MIFRVCLKAEQNAEFVFPHLITESGNRGPYIRSLSQLFREGITGNLWHIYLLPKSTIDVQ